MACSIAAQGGPPYRSISKIDCGAFALTPRELPQIVAKSILYIAGLMKSLRHQRLDARLRGGAAERGDAGIPAGAKLHIRRQAGIDEALGIGDGPFVEAGNP